MHKDYPRRIVLLTGILVLAEFRLYPLSAAEEKTPRLRVSHAGHFLETASGDPFFYLADTAWELFHRLDKTETTLYLDTRARQGFNVIQAVALAEFDGITEPNAEGNLPLLENDPAKPNEQYFKHVDWVIEQAANRGMFVGVLPTWGDKVRKDWGVGPVIFNARNARVYGNFLGTRYRNNPNIIWILGGDRKATGQEDVWREMAAGLREGDGGSHLITYHPQGGLSSSRFWPDEPWLSFHMLQSGHGARDVPNYKMVAADYAHLPPKPVVDGEPRYEDHPVNWKPENGYFDDFDVRQAEYWAVFAGAAGTTYGCHDIWQFLSPRRKPVSSARTPWKTALNLPGANQMQHLRRLMLSRDYFSRVPDQNLLTTNEDGAGHLAATRGANYAFVYSPLGKPVTMQLGKTHGGEAHASWFDPRTGSTTRAETVPNSGTHTFTLPGSQGRGHDTVLVLDTK